MTKREEPVARPACRQCVMGGAVERLANRATHVANYGDGLATLVCGMHADLVVKGAGWVFEIDGLPGFRCAELSDMETRNALQVATYDRRQADRDARRQLLEAAQTLRIKVEVDGPQQ